ncbi:hypothetical protein D5H78_14375 [Vallicoccus soli]|uniref:Uncharacterized protein n=1 Tax=Vallicoccus soli TaxID=2339232 RepID=A0A3A3YU16_9ACTN|nr:hypothetical protein D5H78_14375 [Vallicoccus soli]
MGAPAARPAAAAAGAAAREAERVARQVAGSAAEQRAGRVVEHVRYQRQVEDCMRAAGLDYPRLPLVDVPGGTALPGAWTAPLGADLGAGAQVRAVARQDPAPSARAAQRLAAAEQGPWYARLRGCEPDPSTYLDSHVPAGAVRLGALLAAEVAAAERAGVTAAAAGGYRTCLQRAGVPATSYEDLRLRVLAAYPGQDAVAASRGAGGAWDRAAALEARAAAADGTCRAPLRTAALRALQPRLGPFAAHHAAELRRVRADWAALAAEARRYERQGLVQPAALRW